MEHDFLFIFDAMQQYRKDGAMGFAEWLMQNCWIPEPLKECKIWMKFENGKWDRGHTTEQLYQAYINQKYKKEFVPKKPPQVKNPDGSDHIQYS